MDLFNILIVIVLLILSGLFSGLTPALWSQNPHTLKRKIKAGHAAAKTVYNLRKKGNLLLCTLLIGNVAVNSVLAIFLGSIAAGVIAALVSTGLIVIFGEIIPQAYFTRYSLKFGSKFAWLIYAFLYPLYPVTKPLAMILDKLLGEELPVVMNKREIKLLLEEQARLKQSDLKKSEYLLIKKGLSLPEKITADVMTPRINAFFLSEDNILDEHLLHNIYNSGHSRIPVLNSKKETVTGLLFAKDLTYVHQYHRRKVSSIMRRKVITVKDTDSLKRLLTLFKKKRTHMFIVNNKFGDIVGIITLEDVLEEILGEIIDEYDKYYDMRKLKKLKQK